MTRNRVVPDREAAMPPVFCALRTAGGAVARAVEALLLVVLFGVAAFSPGPTKGFGAVAGGHGSTAIGADGHALPGVSAPTGVQVEAPRETGGADPTGSAGGKRERSRLAAVTAPVQLAEQSRAKAVERDRLRHGLILERACTGHASFHCDTPPPSRV
jgi:hypothetical protein